MKKTRKPTAKILKRLVLRTSAKSGGSNGSKSGTKVLTTGVLNTAVGQTAAHIEVANFSATTSAEVTVQVYDWNSGSPVILLSENVTLPPLSHTIISQDVEPFHYEVRIIYLRNDHVIANTFAINGDTSTVPGLTFNQDQLMRISSRKRK
ncbi:hypothetical protein [Paenibacillus harenae]|uniref:Uncharacterized protein n=1 Tax=Paenibacillus harenae TaxID=306543 RepID=A0ABT9UA51_PAEHA|nr:hypothetical protein [Paenibacillus harenae]MDQ0116539.1 hypothetical protein [Paenibacillus harenae]